MSLYFYDFFYLYKVKMFLSCLMITNSYENLKKRITLESYNNGYTQIKKNNISPYILFYGALLFLIMELILFYYAIIIAKTCSRSGDELIINIIFAIIFTTPYVFFSMLSNPCAKDLFIKKIEK